MNSTGFPYSVGIAQAPIYSNDDIGPQMEIKKEEEKASKSPPILQHSLDCIIPILGNLYVSLLQIKGFLEQAKQDPNAVPQKVQALQTIIDDINQKIVVEIPQHLDILGR